MLRPSGGTAGRRSLLAAPPVGDPRGACCRASRDLRPAEAAVELDFVNKDGVATLCRTGSRRCACWRARMLEYWSRNMLEPGEDRGRRRPRRQESRFLRILKISAAEGRAETADAADALAIAITHAYHRRSTAPRPRAVEVHRQPGAGLIDPAGEDYAIFDKPWRRPPSASPSRTLRAAAAAWRGRGARLTETYKREDQTKTALAFAGDTEREWALLLQYAYRGVGCQGRLGGAFSTSSAIRFCERDRAARHSRGERERPASVRSAAERTPVFESKDKAPHPCHRRSAVGAFFWRDRP